MASQDPPLKIRTDGGSLRRAPSPPRPPSPRPDEQAGGSPRIAPSASPSAGRSETFPRRVERPA